MVVSIYSWELGVVRICITAVVVRFVITLDITGSYTEIGTRLLSHYLNAITVSFFVFKHYAEIVPAQI